MSDLVERLRNRYRSWDDIMSDRTEAAARITELEAQRDELLRHLKMAQLWLDVDGRFDMHGINAAIAKCEAKP